jgi:hypothetical protein
LIPQFTSCIAIGAAERQASGNEMKENDFAGSDEDDN